MNEVKPLIKFEDFEKVDMRIGTVLSVEEIEGSDKLLKLDVDFGEIGKRQILSGIKEWYKKDDLIGKQLAFVINIEPRKMMGLESQGMIMAVDSSPKPLLLKIEENTKDGSEIK